MAFVKSKILTLRSYILIFSTICPCVIFFLRYICVLTMFPFVSTYNSCLRFMHMFLFIIYFYFYIVKKFFWSFTYGTKYYTTRFKRSTNTNKMHQ